MEIAFIYNEFSKDGNFKAVYYDSISPRHDTDVKFMENSTRKIVKISNDQKEEIRKLVNTFIAGSSDYRDSGNEDVDHTLLVSSDDGLRRVNYYYWNDKDVVPKGVEFLLEFFEQLHSTK